MVWRWSNGTPPTLPLRSVLPGGMLLVATAATLKGDPAGGRHRHPEAETVDGVALVERHAADVGVEEDLDVVVVLDGLVDVAMVADDADVLDFGREVEVVRVPHGDELQPVEDLLLGPHQIGRASCRERGEISV